MRIIKDRRVLEDNWQLYCDSESLPAPEELPDGALILPFAFWQQHRAVLLQREPVPGVCVDGDVDPEQLLPDLQRFPLIAVNFPVFTDGRGYSLARLLRERYRYRGELRAVGDVLRDQVFFMMRCGIDSFLLRKQEDIEPALQALEGFSVRYQAACDEPQPLYRRCERS